MHACVRGVCLVLYVVLCCALSYLIIRLLYHYTLIIPDYTLVIPSLALLRD